MWQVKGFQRPCQRTVQVKGPDCIGGYDEVTFWSSSQRPSTDEASPRVLQMKPKWFVSIYNKPYTSLVFWLQLHITKEKSWCTTYALAISRVGRTPFTCGMRQPEIMAPSKNGSLMNASGVSSGVWSFSLITMVDNIKIETCFSLILRKYAVLSFRVSPIIFWYPFTVTWPLIWPQGTVSEQCIWLNDDIYDCDGYCEAGENAVHLGNIGIHKRQEEFHNNSHLQSCIIHHKSYKLLIFSQWQCFLFDWVTGRVTKYPPPIVAPSK